MIIQTELDEIIIQILENEEFDDALIVMLNLLIMISQRILPCALHHFRNEKVLWIIAKILLNKADDLSACILKVINLLVNDSSVEINYLNINHFQINILLNIVRNSIDQDIHMRVAMALFALSKYEYGF